VTSTTVNPRKSVPTVNRPDMVSVGTIVWLGSEVMFFAGLFAIYFTLRAFSPELWAAETSKLNFVFALVNTSILVASSVTAQMGVFAAERMQPRRIGKGMKNWGTVEWFYLTVIMGAIFVSGQVFEYAELVQYGITYDSSVYGSVFYFTTGFHAIHVTLGLFAFLFVIGRIYAVKNFTHKEATSAIAVSYYWHFVDVVWIGLFTVIYVLR